MASLETVDSTSWLAGHRGRLQVNDDFRSLDDAQEQAQFTTTMPASGDAQGAICESHLMVQGMHCAACADAVEAALLKQPGVLSAQVNAATRRVTVRWDKAHTLASSWAQAAAHIGYRLLPVEAALGQVESLKEQRKALWRLFVAGFCAMQVMMYSWPIYVADPGTMDADIEAVLRTHGVVFVVLRSWEPRAEYTPVGRAAHGNFQRLRGSSRGGSGNGAEAHGPNRFIAVRLR